MKGVGNSELYRSIEIMKKVSVHVVFVWSCLDWMALERLAPPPRHILLTKRSLHCAAIFIFWSCHRKWLGPRLHVGIGKEVKQLCISLHYFWNFWLTKYQTNKSTTNSMEQTSVEKVVVAEVIKRFSAFYWIRRLIIVSIRVRHLTHLNLIHALTSIT
jgi:hypothetical protein